MYIFGIEMWHDFLFLTLDHSDGEVIEFSAIEVKDLFPTRDGERTKISFYDIDSSTVLVRYDASLELSVGWNPSVCDFSWKGSNPDGTALISVESYGLKFDPHAPKTRRLTLINDRPITTGFMVQMWSSLTQSRRSIVHTFLGSKEKSEIMTVDEDGRIFLSELPQDMISQHGYIHWTSFMEHFSNAMVFRSKDSTRLSIWYPSGVSYTNGNYI